MAKPFDAVLKWMLDAYAAAWVRYLIPHVGLPPGEPEPLDPDLSTVQPTADKVFRLGPPASGLLHLEVQSDWDGEMPARLLQYNVLLHARYGGPVHSLVLLLRRDANSPQLTGILTRVDANGVEYLRFRYGVVRVWELSADELLAGDLGTAPLGLVTDDAKPRLPALLRGLADRVVEEVPSQSERDIYLTSSALLLGLRYNKPFIHTLFQGLQNMSLRDSSAIQMWIEDGEVKARRRDLLRLLTAKFGPQAVDMQARIQAADDPERLSDAIEQVLSITSPDELTL